MAKAHVKYPVALGEQAVWSILNFGVNLLLLRFLAPHDYGVFFTWSTVGFVLSSVMNAVSVSHLQTLAPGDVLDEPRLSVERLMHMITGVFLLAVALFAFVIRLVMPDGHDLFVALAPAVFLPAYLLQNYVRALAFSRGLPLVALIQTGATLVVVLGLLIWREVAAGLDSATVMMTIGLGYVLVAVPAAWHAMRGQYSGMTGAEAVQELKIYGGYARQSGWIFIGVTSTEVLARFYAFAVAAWFGPVALASLGATQQLLRPLPLLANSFVAVEKADLARRRDEGDYRGIGKVTLLACLGGFAFSMIWTFGIYFAWPWVSRHLFDGKYRDDDWMVILWGLASAISFAQVVVSASLQSLRAFKALALVNLAASLGAAGAILVIMRLMGYTGAILGTTVGQLIELVAMAALLRLLIQRQSTPSPTSNITNP